jgi:O-antigen/teichoic acid export membrane protein
LEFGLTTTLTRHLAAAKATGDYDQANRILGQLATMMWSVGFLITLGAIIGSLLLPHIFKLEPDQARLFQWAFLLIGIQAALGVITNIWEGAMGAAEDYHVLNGLYIFAALARLAYSVVLLKLGYGLLALLCAQFVVIGTVWLLDHLYMKWRYPQLSFRPRWFGWKEAKPLAKFSGAVFLSHIAGLLANDTDKIIAGALLGPAAVAVYQVGYKLYDLARTLFANSVTVLIPTSATLFARNENKHLQQMIYQVSSVMIGIVAAIYIPLIFYGDDFIRLWVGPKFDLSAVVLIWLSIGILTTTHNRVLGIVFWGVGDWKIATYPTLVYAISNFIVSILLCLRWGLIGIAAGTTLTLIPTNIWCTVYGIRRFRLSWWEFFGRAWVGALLGSGIGWLCGEAITLAAPRLSLQRLFLQSVFFEIGFWLIMVTVGFNSAIRQHLKITLNL